MTEESILQEAHCPVHGDRQSDYGHPASILQEAHRLVHGDRQSDYGHPADDFSRTGRLWAAILGLEEVTPQQVALCMVCVKLSREVNRPKRDNRVDGAGYLETLDMIEECKEGE